MENLLIEGTESSPYINFDKTTDHLIVHGESFPENATQFYVPVFDWLKTYLTSLNTQEVIVEFEMVYFNSSTSKLFMNIFDMLDEAVVIGKNITVHWHCNAKNDAAIECGEEFMEDLKHLPFQIIIFE